MSRDFQVIGWKLRNQDSAETDKKKESRKTPFFSVLWLGKNADFDAFNVLNADEVQKLTARRKLIPYK
jgi:hypothetical protein